MGGGRYTQNFTSSCGHGVCAFIGSVATDDQRNTDCGTWGHKCVDWGDTARCGYTEKCCKWSKQIIRGHHRIVVQKF